MASYVATVRWQRGEQPFIDNRYSRAHQWEFDGGVTVQASASPHIVPEPMSVAANVDPEEAFVAALSSCHMLFFLSLAVTRGIVVNDYVDHAVATLRKNSQGRMLITEVVLHPQTHFVGAAPSPEVLGALHAEAHEQCFIANSVRSEVRIELES